MFHLFIICTTELRNGDAADVSKKADIVVVNGHEKTNGINPANANKITEVTHKVVANENGTQVWTMTVNLYSVLLSCYVY